MAHISVFSGLFVTCDRVPTLRVPYCSWNLKKESILPSPHIESYFVFSLTRDGLSCRTKIIELRYCFKTALGWPTQKWYYSEIGELIVTFGLFCTRRLAYAISMA